MYICIYIYIYLYVYIREDERFSQNQHEYLFHMKLSRLLRIFVSQAFIWSVSVRMKMTQYKKSPKSAPHLVLLSQAAG